MFNTSGARGRVSIQLADGTYEDALTGKQVEVRGGTLEAPADTCILRAGPLTGVQRLMMPLLDCGYEPG